MRADRIIKDFPGFENARNRAPGYEEYSVFNPNMGQTFFDPQDLAASLVREDSHVAFEVDAWPKSYDVTGPGREQLVRVPEVVREQLELNPVARLVIRREMSYYRAENPQDDSLAFHVTVSAMRRLRSPRPLAEFLQIAPADSYRGLFGGAVRIVFHDKDGETFVPIGPDHFRTNLFLRDFGLGQAMPVEGLRTRLLGSGLYQVIKRQGTW